jgi:hypothetical protein
MSKNTSDDFKSFGLGADNYDDDDLDEDRGDDALLSDDDEELVLADDDADPEVVPEVEPEVVPEADPEVEPTADEATPTPEEDKPAKAQKDNRMVPRDRLNQEINKRKEVERQLETLRTQRPADAPAEMLTTKTLDKAQLKIALEAVLDGKTDDATEVLASVLTSLQPANAPKQEFTHDQLATAVEQALDHKALTARASEVVDQFDFLDDSNEETFDADAAEEVIQMRDLYIRRGMKPVDALDKAVQRVAEEFGYVEKAEAPAPAAPAKQKLKPADIAKKIDMAKKVPARIPKTDSQSLDANMSAESLSDDEFDKLSGTALARARGDIM